MIKKLDLTNRKIAQEVLNVQIPAYKAEAEMIGSTAIPALKDTIYTLQNSGETFFGYYKEKELCGAISIKATEDEIDIHRLIVHPNHFQQGIGQALLNFIESEYKTPAIKVATASKNIPAINLYKKNGFHHIKETQVTSNLSLSHFKKIKEPPKKMEVPS